jgi:hypothetical protein
MTRGNRRECTDRKNPVKRKRMISSNHSLFYDIIHYRICGKIDRPQVFADFMKPVGIGIGNRNGWFYNISNVFFILRFE